MLQSLSPKPIDEVKVPTPPNKPEPYKLNARSPELKPKEPSSVGPIKKRHGQYNLPQNSLPIMNRPPRP